MASGLGLAMGAVGGYTKYVEGDRMENDARMKINSFKWQDLNNPYKTLKVSTLGADLQREENTRMNASIEKMLQGAGTRATAASLGTVVAGSNDVNRKIAAGLDEQQKNIDQMAAQDEVRKQQMIEGRQANELAGYGQMMNIGRQEKYGGISDMMNTAFAASSFIPSGDRGGGMGGSAMGGGSLGGGYNDKAAVLANYYSKYGAVA